MTTETLDRPQTINIQASRQATPCDVEPNFGPEDMHAIRAIFGLMVGIFTAALVMYGTITFFVWLGS